MGADFDNYRDLHGIDAATIRESAEDPRINAQTIQALEDELVHDETSVADALEGDIEAGTRNNPAQARQVAQGLAQKGYYAVGLMNQFAAAVDVFDAAVADLNTRLATAIQRRNDTNDDLPEEDRSSGSEISSAAKAALQGEYDTAVEALDTAADEVAAKFAQGPTPENVRELFREGLIPLEQQSLWPDMALTPDDKREAYQNAIENGTMPDFSTMTQDEVQAYLSDNPSISADMAVLMASASLSPALTNLVNAQAALDADLLNTAIDDPDPDADTLARIDEATQRLAAINDSIGPGADDGKMTAAQADYIENFLNTVGADNLAKLPEVVRSAAQESLPGSVLPSQVDDMVRQRLAPIADSILNYSNPDVQRPDAGIDRAGYNGGSTFTPADGRITVSEMPQAIQDLTAMRLGYDNGPGSRLGVEPDEYTTNGPGRNGQRTYEEIDQDQFSSVLNYDKYSGYADLMSSASDDVEGGADYSQALGEQAIQARQDLNAISETASDTVIGHEGTGSGRGVGPAEYAHLTLNATDGPMSDMLGVTARSEDGSSQLLLDDDNRQSLLSLDWADSDGATDVITSGTDRDPAGGGDTEQQARAAAAIMGDVAEDPDVWNGRMNEAMEDAVLDTGLRWVDTFGVAGDPEAGVDPDGRDSLGRDVGPTIAMTDAAKENFMLFAAGTGDEQAVRFQAGLTHYGNQLINDALSGGGDLPSNAQGDNLKNALAWSGTADGRMGAANIQSTMNAMGEENDVEVATAIAENREIAANKAATTFLTSIATSGAGAIPGAGPFISAGAGALSGPIIDSIFEEQPVPDFDSFEDNRRTQLIDEAAENAAASRDYRFAGLVAGQYADDPQYSHLYTSDGQLRDFNDLSGVEKREVTNLGANLYEDFNERHPGMSPVTRADTYDESFRLTLDDAGVNQDEDDPDETAEEREERERDEAAAEEAALRRLLYGDNQHDWERWNDTTPQTPHPRQQPSPRESPYDTTVGAND